MNHEKPIRDYIRAYNSFDVEGMMATVHEKIHFENIAAGQINLHGKSLFWFREGRIIELKDIR